MSQDFRTEAKESPSVFTRARVITPEQEIANGVVIVQGGTITNVGLPSVIRIPSGCREIDCRNRILVPGFVDLHVHGGGGREFSEEEGGCTAARFHARHGTTSLLATLGPAAIAELDAGPFWGEAGRLPDAEEGGPEILGLYLEGPFLNRGKRGVLDASRFRDPEPAWVDALQKVSDGKIRMMTLAPELPGGEALIREILQAGILPALGHSDASFGEARRAFDCGVRHVTHLFNAMRGIHHREPGCVAAALLDPDVTVEVIPDGHHLHDATVGLIHRLKGVDRMIVVTDAVALCGVPDGSRWFEGSWVTLRDGRVENSEGRLAGSLLTMDRALRRMVREIGIPLQEVLRMMTLNPARILGISHRKGRILPGADADLVLLNESLEVESVYIRGVEV